VKKTFWVSKFVDAELAEFPKLSVYWLSWQFLLPGATSFGSSLPGFRIYFRNWQR